MKFSALMRTVHNWGSTAIALPVLVIIGSGLFLHLKKEIAWIQPPTLRGAGTVPAISFDRILEAARAVPEAEIRAWDDVDRLDVRPGRGIVKVQPKGVAREIQVDLQTGEVLQVAVRRSDLIESIHDGSWFHARAKHWLFLPSAIGLFILWATGLFLFVYPYWRRGARSRALPKRVSGVTD